MVLWQVIIKWGIKVINKKIDICYNDKLEGNITLDVYKRNYNSFMKEIDSLENRKKEYNKILDNLSNNQLFDDIYTNIKDFLDMSKPNRILINLLIDRIEISEDNNIDIYYKFKL